MIDVRAAHLPNLAAAPQSRDAMGFDRSLFLAEPGDDFICTLCEDVLDTPVSACQEGHTFCRGCLQKWADQLKADRKPITCPNCRAKVSSVASASRNRIVENLISAMSVRCKHAKALASWGGGAKQQCSGGAAATFTCQWTGKKSELEAHLESACQYVPVACPHEGCDARMLRAQLTAHTKTCPRRPATCPDCSKTMPHCELVSTHGDICPARQVPCPNCGREIARRHMARHIEYMCEKTPVACPYGASSGPCPHARVCRPMLT